MALIKNEAKINEELDPRLVIQRLKREVDELRNQIAMVNGGELASTLGELSANEMEK